MPPLRDRREDVPLLLDWFFGMFAQHYRVDPPEVSQEAMDLLMAYDWPGNVRELRNVVERLLIRGHKAIISEHLPHDVASPTKREPAHDVAARPRTAHVDRLVERMVTERESFWSVVYDAFMAHDLTRDDVRAIVGRGVSRRRGTMRRWCSSSIWSSAITTRS